MRQWMQVSNTAHGPTLRHVFHWTNLSPNTTARTYYIEAFRHVMKVLNDELEGKEWLVGGKCSAADLSFVSFQSRIGFILRDDVPDMEKEYPRVDAWYKRMAQRQTVKKVTGEHVDTLKAYGFVPK